MRLTNKGRYAVMAMADLASNEKLDQLVFHEISLRQNISLPYLEQIFIKLKNFKLVKSLRGPLGGYVLDRPASEIKISNIINAVDEEVKTLNCKKTQKGCHNKSTKCITHNLWYELDQHINGFLKKLNFKT